MPTQDIRITGADIARWQEARDRYRNEIKSATDKLADVERKLTAAAVLAAALHEETPTVQRETFPVTAPASNDIHDSDDEPIPASDRLYDDLAATGESLKVAQIRERLVKLGVPQAETKNYVYGLVYRMVQGGRLLKRGAKYRAAPKPSPQGEAGAVAAPASSVTH
jgi:hypothetical protein